jgi:hypothetical protein
MASSGKLRRVALVRTDVSEGLSASFIRARRIGELGKRLAVNSNQPTQRGNLKSYSAHNGYDGNGYVSLIANTPFNETN